jgi:hypothetical protein
MRCTGLSSSLSSDGVVLIGSDYIMFLLFTHH